MIDDIKNDAKTRMGKSVESLVHELAKVRTGRAHPSLLDHIRVDYYVRMFLSVKLPISMLKMRVH